MQYTFTIPNPSPDVVLSWYDVSGRLQTVTLRAGQVVTINASALTEQTSFLLANGFLNKGGRPGPSVPVVSDILPSNAPVDAFSAIDYSNLPDSDPHVPGKPYLDGDLIAISRG